MTRARYLNGTRYCDLGPEADLRFLYLIAIIALFFSGGFRCQR